MAAGDLTTLTNVKQYLGLQVATDDALIGRLITAASAWVKSYLNRDILSTAYVEVIDGNDSERIVVGNFPVTAVSGIAVLNDTAVASSALVFDGNTITRVDGQTFSWGRSNLTVSYTAGYASTPMDIEEAVIEIVALRYREKDRVGTSTVNTHGESVTFSVVDVPAAVKTLLRNWRNVVPA